VAYFDPADLTAEKERAVDGQLAAALPGVPWQAKNQAAVHLWYGERFGVPVPPLASLNEAVGTWPEYATAVAVRRGRSHTIEVIAPLGLDDLLDGIWRWNPPRASFEEALRRLRSKSVPSRWPGVIVDEELRAGLSQAPIGARAMSGRGA
jgi:hypothetical protein